MGKDMIGLTCSLDGRNKEDNTNFCWGNFLKGSHLEEKEKRWKDDIKIILDKWDI
jgi:hypothetical protein